ncbi:MAG: hypothetical protein ABSD20_17445 [Terriglobales bacterium]|jgi:hypothetical protein
MKDSLQPELAQSPPPIAQLLDEVRQLIVAARRQTAAAVNLGLTALYWRIGKRIRHEVLVALSGAIAPRPALPAKILR